MITEMPVKGLEKLLDRPIAYHRVFCTIAGSATAGLLLSQMYYWSRNVTATERGGWFWKSEEDWEEETGLTRREQQTARAHLRGRGLIEEKREGLPARLWFRVRRDHIVGALQQLIIEYDKA